MIKRLTSIIICAFLCFNLCSCTGNQNNMLSDNMQGYEDYLDCTLLPSGEQVEYPKGISFHDYDGSKNVRNDNPVDPAFIEAVNEFTDTSTAKIFMNEQDKNKNLLYSPISLFLALSLSATGANEETENEILSVLHTESEKDSEISIQTNHLYNLLYTDNEIGQLKIANSLWLSNKHKLNKSFLENANKNYYASLFPVDFNDEVTSDLIEAWIDKNSKGTLNANIPVDKNQIMALINCIYFYDEWQFKFDEEKTQEDTFFLNDGENVQNDFMNMETLGSYIDGDGYLSTSLSFKNHEAMTFYLPDEGINVYDLISTPEDIEKLLDNSNTENESYGEITFKIPKFNFGSSLSLKDSLMKLGMSDAFSYNADFSGITDDVAFINDITQSTHISIDEKGCEAAAYTEIDYCGSALPTDHIDMILNRPFIFTITSKDVVLFIGVVNNPNDK